MALYYEDGRGRAEISGFGFDDLGDDVAQPYMTKLQATIRKFPKSFTWEQAAQALDAAVLDGKQAGSKFGLPGMGVDTAPLYRAIAAAEALAQSWRNKAPWFWQTAQTYASTSAEGKAVLAAVTAVYAEASAIAGEREVVKQARTELLHDLKTDLAPSNIWDKAKPWVIGGAVLLGVMALSKVTSPVRALVNPLRRRRRRRRR